MASTGRILTTHVGSLPRPPALLEVMRDRAEGRPYDAAALDRLLHDSVRAIVQQQVDAGIDIVSDGELSKPSYSTYVTKRLSGFGGTSKIDTPADLREFKAYAIHLVETGGIIPASGVECCQGPVVLKDDSELKLDLANYRDAVDAVKPHAAFLTAPSPGVISVFQKNRYYPSETAYIEAVASAMRAEYEAIVAAGFILQIDSPDLAMGRHMPFAELDDAAFVTVVERNVATLNEAVRNIPADRMRMHVCWGNYEGPHHRDIALPKILDAVLRAKPAFLALEGANPRHEHEWAAFRDVKLPDGKVLIPGVIDSTSNYIEHPELVAQRLERYAGVVGRERVMAGTDCGFATFSGSPNVHPDLVWKKLESLVEGARIASGRLYG